MVIPTAEMLRAAAKELDERAEKMIGDVRGVTGVDIWIRLRPDTIPEITVSKDYTTQRQIQNFLDESRRQSDDGISQGTGNSGKTDPRGDEGKNPDGKRHHPPKTDHPDD